MITIDGSSGEGGGQILRTSLALSLVTGKPFRMEKIRAKRNKPGLLRQHLTAVNAAAEVSAARVEGQAIGASELTFAPGPVRAGNYHWAVGTAGSATLVLQSVLPGLLLADGLSALVLEGGTHNPYAPPFDFLAEAFLPVINRMGPRMTASLERHGFYPAGGGRFTVGVTPVAQLAAIRLMERGDIVRHEGVALMSQLPRLIGEKELELMKGRLSWGEDCFRVEEVPQPRGPGNVLMCRVASANITEVFTGFGERGVPADQVAMAVVDEVHEYLAAGVPVGRHLADQLLIPLALAGGGAFRTVPPTRHARTNMDVIREFLDVEIRATKVDRLVWDIEIAKR